MITRTYQVVFQRSTLLTTWLASLQVVLMRERGRYQIQLMKTRSSSGVGSKVDLEFDVDSLRIRDLADDDEYQEFDKRKSTIYEGLKRKTMDQSDTGEEKLLIQR